LAVETISAIDTAAIMVNRAHSAWKEDLIACDLIVDNKTALPSVARGRLIHAMKATQTDRDRRQWTEEFLYDRRWRW
jgi:hypothetical protein